MRGIGAHVSASEEPCRVDDTRCRRILIGPECDCIKSISKLAKVWVDPTVGVIHVKRRVTLTVSDAHVIQLFPAALRDGRDLLRRSLEDGVPLREERKGARCGVAGGLDLCHEAGKSGIVFGLRRSHLRMKRGPLVVRRLVWITTAMTRDKRGRIYNAGCGHVGGDVEDIET